MAVTKYLHCSSWGDLSNLLMMSWSEVFLGGPPKLWSFRYPQQLMFYCIFKKEFSKCGVLYARNFFEKFFKTCKRNFWNFFKNEKIIILVVKLDQNHHVDQNLAKFSLKTKKRQFPDIPLFFQNFRRLRRQKCGVGVNSLGRGPQYFWSWSRCFSMIIRNGPVFGYSNSTDFIARACDWYLLTIDWNSFPSLWTFVDFNLKSSFDILHGLSIWYHSSSIVQDVFCSI